ncbi:YdcF family protein [Paenibacillus septentrionalis]|uniref:YdcF family protein n=1 Tax=Paenibacillus septentrionalis TaxID=429342 RepID=A0ABW1V0K6_9BACL
MIISKKIEENAGEGLSTKRLLNVTASAAGLLIIWFIVHTTFIVIDGLNDELKPVDAAVVLGNKVETNGQPSERLKARLDKAAELYDRGYYTFIIVSGGIGKEGFDEAAVMKSYLIDQGIAEDSIIEDNNGYNSYMTAQNTSKIMDELKLDSVMIITQYFHISRTKLAFGKMDMEEVYSAHANIFELRDIYSIIREFPAYYKYLFK